VRKADFFVFFLRQKTIPTINLIKYYMLFNKNVQVAQENRKK